jgi:hypothetical protein
LVVPFSPSQANSSKTNIVGYAVHKCQVFSAARAKSRFVMRFVCPTRKLKTTKKTDPSPHPFEQRSNRQDDRVAGSLQPSANPTDL